MNLVKETDYGKKVGNHDYSIIYKPTMQLEQDRAFDIDSLHELLSQGTSILQKADDTCSKMESSIALVSRIYNKIDGDCRLEALGIDIAALSHSLGRDMYQDTKKLMDDKINNIIGNIPDYDREFGQRMNNLGEALQSIKGRITDLQSMLTPEYMGLSNEDFKQQLSNLIAGWDQTTEDLKIDLIAVELDMYGLTHTNAVRYSEDPVNLSTGNFVYDHEDLKIYGEIPLSFHRFYNAKDRAKGSMGRCFLHNYEMYLEENTEKGKVTICMGDGQKKTFRKNADGTYQSLYSSTEILFKESDDHILRELSGENYVFDRSGKIVRMENRYKKGITFIYDESGRLEKAATDNEAFLTYSYNETGQLILVTDHVGRSVKLSYEKGKLATVQTPQGSIYGYCYGKNGRIEETINSRGYVAVKNTYDNKRRVTHQVFADGSHMEFAYDDSKRQVILTERNGSKITYIHDNKFRNTDILYEDGTKEHFEYNAKNQRILRVDRNGNITRMAYDNRGNLTQVINALGQKTNLTYNAENQLCVVKINEKEKKRIQYDKCGNLISSVDAGGNGSKIIYDEKGRPICIENADESKITIAYDSRGNVKTIRDTLGNTTKYEYDALNRVIETTDPKGNRSGYEYDAAGNIVKYVNAAGEVRSYVYNESKKVTEIVDFNGSKIKRNYNALNRLETVTDQEGRVTQLGYDAMWNVGKITLPDGAVTTYSYDKNNRLEAITDAMGNVTRFTYDGNGNRISVEDSEGATTTFSYDALGRLIQVIDPEGAGTIYEYDNEGNLVKVTDALGNEVVRTYDEMGRLVLEKNTDGESRAYAYTKLGNVKSVMTETGLKIRYSYLPGETKISSIEYPDGTKETYTYDANGNLESKTNANGYTLYYSYDCLNQVTEISDSEGGHKFYTYDAVGNIISMTDANGNVTRYEYSLTGMLTTVIDALGNIAEYTYDENDKLIGILQKGEVAEEPPRKTEYKRNLLGKIETVTDALGGQEHYKYNKRGELIEKRDREGYLTRYSYTKCGDLNYVQYSDGREVMLSYNSLRQLEEIKDWIGVTAIKNDAAGRAIEVAYPNGEKVAYTYGAAGKLTSLTYPDGKIVYYGYDELCRLTELREGDTTIRYHYDAMGRLSEKIFPNGMTTNYEYDARGLLASMTHRDGEGILDAYSYQYDLAANKTGITKTRRGLPEESGNYYYGYDALGRLDRVEKDGEVLRSYQYDAYGNRVSLIEKDVIQNYSYNALNQLISRVDITAEGRTEEQFIYDKRGNLSQILLNGQMQNQYVYGPFNRIEWAMNAAGEEVSYIYNGLGHRIGKQEGQELSPAVRADYVLDLTKSYNNLLQRVEEGKRQTFLWDGNAVEIIDEDSTHNFYFQDELGSPIRVADMEGMLRETNGYDEFGRDLYQSQGQVQPLGYTGYQSDRIAGTYYAQAREYVPSTGQFAARDLDKFIKVQNTHSINLYSYCMSNPMRFVDPSGNTLEDVLKELYPKPASHKSNEAVQIDISGNDVTIDVYVDFIGEENLTTVNGTSCKDLALAGIEQWSGYYLDVFGEDIQVTVNVHEGDGSLWDSQKYVEIHFESDILPENKQQPITRYYKWSLPIQAEWSISGRKVIYMYNKHYVDEFPYTDEQYLRTITHEMGHVFGIDDGYSLGPRKIDSGIISENDIMNYQYNKLEISSQDIGMLIVAYTIGTFQAYADYGKRKQSDYIKNQKEKE